MAILRRPMFRTGGRVDSRGTGITSGLEPKRGLVNGPGGYAGEVEDYKKVLEEVNLAMPEQKGLSLADYLRIASAGAKIVGAPGRVGGSTFKNVLATAAEPLSTLGTELAGSMEKRGLARQAEVSDIAQALFKAKYGSTEGVFDRKLNQLSSLMAEKQKLGVELQGLNSDDPQYKSKINRLEIIQSQIDLISKSDPTLEGLAKNSRYQQWAIAAVEAETGMKADNPKFPWYRVQEKMKTGGKQIGAQEEKAEGGRIGYEGGGLTEMMGQQQNVPQEDTAQETPDLSYAELRSRLPKEITDEVVLLLSRSQQALIDFSNISTQKDVDEFNAKYGVQLVLPQV